MENTLREYLKNKLTPDYYDRDNPDHRERLTWAIQGYFSNKGMEWTADDANVIMEYGDDPQDYITFDEEQEMQIDEILSAAQSLVFVMLNNFRELQTYPPLSYEELALASEIADAVADVLTSKGLDVYYPVHVETGEEDGTEYISDLYEKKTTKEDKPL